MMLTMTMTDDDDDDDGGGRRLELFAKNKRPGKVDLFKTVVH